MSWCKNLICIHPADTVAVALEDIRQGEVLPCAGRRVTARSPIARGHKIALDAMAAGTAVIKYGAPIGHAARDIAAGEHVHRHNLATNLSGVQDYRYQPYASSLAPAETEETFAGYVRRNGAVGIRNELWIIPTAGCVNGVAERLAQRAVEQHAYGTVEGVYAFPHPYGCSQLGGDHRATQRILAGLVNHPNAGGVLVVGLGCENNHLAEFLPRLGAFDCRRVKFLNCQEVDDEMAEGMVLLDELARTARRAHRKPAPIARLRVGVKCGGSDGLSGITANPLVGMYADRLVAAGGTVVMTETPEMFGAEHLLLQRCASKAVFERLVAAVNGSKDSYLRHGEPIAENPSPGNLDGGITTLEEKSLGCVQKGGSSAVVDVLEYGERLHRQHGLQIVQAPGNDLVSATALVAAGAHLLLFTTGRGTPLGAPAPTVKIATNSALAQRKAHWIDFDAGALLDGQEMPALCDALAALVREVASGRQTRNEMNDERQIAIWKDGVTL